MNLIFNTFITNESLNEIHGKTSEWQKIRNTDTSFRRRDKIDIFKYTVDSYKFLNFKKKFFWVECEDPSRHKEINDYILNVFPDAFISNKRCLKLSEYSEILDVIDNEWIFYSPNNDHPFWSSEQLDLSNIFRYANSIVKEYDGMVGIFYSHFEEFYNLAYKDSWFGQRYNNEQEPRKTIEDNDEFVSFASLNGENTSVQILHPRLFKTMFSSLKDKTLEIRRMEDLRPYFQIRNQVSIVPKFLICAHFDGQPSLNPYVLPPLFIPDGYFENKINLAVNQRFYQKQHLNISSKFKLPSFLDARMGCDFVGEKKDLPLFIKNKINEN